VFNTFQVSLKKSQVKRLPSLSPQGTLKIQENPWTPLLSILYSYIKIKPFLFTALLEIVNYIKESGIYISNRPTLLMTFVNK